MHTRIYFRKIFQEIIF